MQPKQQQPQVKGISIEKKFNPYCLYHEQKAPEGLIIKNEEMEKKLGSGWVDTPALFGKKPDLKKK